MDLTYNAEIAAKVDRIYPNNIYNDAICSSCDSYSWTGWATDIRNELKSLQAKLDSKNKVKTETKEETKETEMKKFNIVDYKVYNNKVVIVKFDDGTEEKATCMDGDSFDFERAIEVVIMKKILGTSEYNKAIHDAMKQINAVDKTKEEQKQIDLMVAKKKETARKKKEKTRENRRKRRIANMKEAYLAAMVEFGNMMYSCENDIEFADDDFYSEHVNCETCENRDSCDDWK